MEELTQKNNGNGYAQARLSNEASPSISQGLETVSISISGEASVEVNTEPRTSQSLKHCMRKVPVLLRREERNKCDYDPAVASFGPYHHGKLELKLVEDFKPKALELFVEGSGMDTDFFYNKVLEAIQIQDLRRCYVENSTDKYDDAGFARMMLLDACVIINYIWMWLECKDMIMSQGIINYYETFEATIYQHPISKTTSVHLGSLDIILLLRDMFLLENQIPLCLLKLLISLKYGKDEGEKMLSKFLSILISLEDRHIEENKREEPLHLLGALRRLIVSDCSKDDQTRSWSIFERYWKTEKINHRYNLKRYFHTFRSATDLKAKGIHFQPSNSHSLKDIKFKSSYFYGELQLPTCSVSIYTKVFFLNLIAFEMCPNNLTDHTVSTYINFMKSLIESPKDVKELREKHILIDELGSDEEVMQVYKDINTFGANNYGIFYETRKKIQEHYNSKAKTWVAELIHTYFSSPWTVIALFTAFSFLCLTFIQTYFTIHPSPDK